MLQYFLRVICHFTSKGLDFFFLKLWGICKSSVYDSLTLAKICLHNKIQVAVNEQQQQKKIHD